MNRHITLQPRDQLDDNDTAFGDVRPAGREHSGLEAALRAASELAVVWAFGLALLLILAQRA